MDVLAIFQWFEAHLNYGTIMLLMAVESSFVPFPSEVVVAPASYFAMQGADLNVVLVVLVATVGAMIGATINYFIALWVGRPIIYKFANSRLGHILLIDEKKVRKAESYFDRHGAVSTFLGRLIPAVRQLISIPAGLARMNYAKFALYTALGAGIWNCVLAALGYWLSTFVPQDELMEQIEHYNRYLSWAGYALAAVIVLFILYQVVKKKPAVEEEQSV